jgi:hypothetical protein
VTAATTADVGGHPGLKANLWVAPSDCDPKPERLATPLPFADAPSTAKACTFDQAWDALRPGDEACVRPGRYPAQRVDGDKPAAATLRGCEGGVVITTEGVETCGFQGGAVCANAGHLTLAGVTVDSGEAHGTSIGAEVNGVDVTLRDVRFHGRFVSVYIRGGGFAWHGGSLGEDGTVGGKRQNPGECGAGDGLPLQIESGGPALIERVRFNPQQPDLTPTSCSRDGFHLETVRVEGTPDVTFRDNRFVDGGGAGSGHIFLSGAGAAKGQRFEDNYFGKLRGSYAVQVSATVGTCDWAWKGNTFRLSALGTENGCGAGARWAGNHGGR